MKDTNKIKDLTGQKFGRLTVIGLDDKPGRKTYWICKCDCGNVKSVRSDSLQGGRIKSCGCLKVEQDKKNLHSNRTHGQCFTRMYFIWQKMKARCGNIHDTRYHRYGGRGISVCDEWKNSFENFYKWSIENGYSDDLSIDRIDNDGNYCPENCRWITNKEQCNNRSTNIKITIGNSTRTLTEWCDIFNLDYGNIIGRYHRNGFIGIDELFNKG